MDYLNNPYICKTLMQVTMLAGPLQGNNLSWTASHKGYFPGTQQGFTVFYLQLLQRIEDPGICLAISEQSLDQHPNLAASHFLADYLTAHFYVNLTTARRNEIQALYMGSKVSKTPALWD